MDVHLGQSSAAQLFWLSNLVTVFLITLHFVREWCMPDIYQPRFVLFYTQDADRKDPASKRNDKQLFLTYDSGAIHDNETGLPREVAATATDADTEQDVAYEDEHLMIFNKKADSPKPKTLFAFRLIQNISSAEAEVTVRQIMAATFLYLVQTYAVHRSGIENLKLVKHSTTMQGFALCNFTITVAVYFTSAAILMYSIITARKYPAALSETAKYWLLTILHSIVCISVLSLPVPCFRLITSW